MPGLHLHGPPGDVYLLLDGGTDANGHRMEGDRRKLHLVAGEPYDLHHTGWPIGNVICDDSALIGQLQEPFTVTTAAVNDFLHNLVLLQSTACASSTYAASCNCSVSSSIIIM